MRHAPTTLYIDTEFIKRQSLRFDKPAFNNLKEKFVRKGLRLLVPEIMERELLRHFQREAKDAAGKLINAHKNYPVDKLGLAEIPSERKIQSRCREEMESQWSEFMDHFVVENLPIVGDMEEVVNWYFEILPPFSANKKDKEFPDAMIISALDHYHKYKHANIAVISGDKDFQGACVSRSHLIHYKDLCTYIKEFQPELSKERMPPGDIDPTKPIIPITTEDLTAIKFILGQGDSTTSIEVERVMDLLQKRGASYDYFFTNADHPVWIDHLDERGYFDDPPDVNKTIKGNIYNTWWPPIDYLIRVFDRTPEKVLDILSKLPDTNNYWVLESILKIVLRHDSAATVLRFSKFITSYIDNYTRGEGYIISLLKKPFIFDQPLSEITPALLLKIIEFRKDSRKNETEPLQNDYAEDWGLGLKPMPRFDEWAYREILEEGVCHLAKRKPYQVASILIDAVASMTRLGMHKQELDAVMNEDYSEIWCPKLNITNSNYQDIRGILLQTLTYACEQVYYQVPESVDALDQALRNRPWTVFLRLRQHLYSTYPNDQTLPWIREQILSHGEYSRLEHHYEFQLMVRKASEHFGHRLLSEGEKREIFDNILIGPSKEDYLYMAQGRFSHEAFQKRQRYFHLKQLRPFATLLTGDVRSYFNKLKDESDADDVTDDSYLAVRFKESTQFPQQTSPKYIEELETFTDEDLISYLNEWEWGQEHLDDDWFHEISIHGLAKVFQSLFKEKIMPDGNRLKFWMINQNRITRPIYVTAILNAIIESVKEKNFNNFDHWICFCEWVLSHPDSFRLERQPEPFEESRDHPDWNRSRRAVVDFIETCVNKDVGVSVVERDGLGKLLQKVCNQPDHRLDDNLPTLLNQNDPITEAINNTRSHALDTLVKFGLWIKHDSSEDSLPEVTGILSQRMADDAEFPLTRPEHVILAMHFENLYWLNSGWATGHREKLFPIENETIWWDAFGTYIRFNQSYIPVFEALRNEFQYAIENIKLSAKSDNKRVLVNRLGQHLFTYYLWKAYPLQGNESLLESFYSKTSDHRARWRDLFDYVGRSLMMSGKNLDKNLMERIVDFFDWRYQQKEQMELSKFTFWLNAEGLDPDWRLESYLKILDLGQVNANEIHQQVRYLTKYLPEHLALVMKCLVKATSFDELETETQIYFPANEIKAILKAGIDSESKEIRQNADSAKENLLRSGRLEFL